MPRFRLLVLTSVLALALPRTSPALVVVRSLDLVNTGLGPVQAAAVDVAGGTDGLVQLLFEDPDYYRDPNDDRDDHRTLLLRRLTTDGVWRGEGRIDDTNDPDRTASIAVLPDGVGFVWQTVENRSARLVYRSLRAADYSFSPVTPVVPDAASASETALAALPGGVVVVWSDQIGIRGRVLATNGAPLGGVFDVALGATALPDVAAVPGLGFVVGWFDALARDSRVRVYTAGGIPVTEPVIVLPDGIFSRLAVGDDGAGALVAIRAATDQLGLNGPVIVQRFAGATGAPIGGEIAVADETNLARPDVGIDFGGNLLVTWGRQENSAPSGVRGRAFAADGTPLGGVVTLAIGVVKDRVRASRLPDGSFVVAHVNDIGYPFAEVVSLCDPGSAVCGDGVVVSTCERCDDGAANSDVTPDACRSDCTTPRCSDGVVDGDEQCDDGNLTSCDGCSAACAAESGLVCGDGVTAPAGCGEACDDGNIDVGDGCAPDCTLERIRGGGSSRTDCYTEWQVNNPANQPLVDRRGAFGRQQTCVDDDPRCDFDGGVPGACTFHVAVCANNVDAPSCPTPGRLASWTVERPSASQAAQRPELAAIRSALASVPAAIVGPQQSDLCSAPNEVVVPLHGAAPAWRPAKATIKTRATLYDDTSDVDTLKLVCLPAS